MSELSKAYKIVTLHYILGSRHYPSGKIQCPSGCGLPEVNIQGRAIGVLNVTCQLCLSWLTSEIEVARSKLGPQREDDPF